SAVRKPSVSRKHDSRNVEFAAPLVAFFPSIDRGFLQSSPDTFFGLTPFSARPKPQAAVFFYGSYPKTLAAPKCAPWSGAPTPLWLPALARRRVPLRTTSAKRAGLPG